jgi:type II secretory pathway pseudopilin PulG
MKMRRARAGFTLVEMLVVISITIVLLGLILGPVIQVFNMTKEAHAMVTAQDTARFTLEQVSRELGQAMFVYDNSNSTLVFPCTDSTGATVTPQAPFAKIDIIIPKGVMHCNNPSHPASDPRDYERGDEAWPPCPYCASTDVEFRPVEPLTQDSKIVRYFVGLADPSTPRDWEDAGPPANGFVLYRAEFDPYEKNLVDQGPNGPILDDPNFFYGTHMAAWKAIAKPVGPKKDVDLVVLKTDPATNAIISAESSVRFRLTQITNDSFSPAYVTDFASDTPAEIQRFSAQATAPGAPPRERLRRICITSPW